MGLEGDGFGERGGEKNNETHLAIGGGACMCVRERD
jgi:hypothetical protein